MIDVTLLGTSALLPLPDRFLASAHLSFFGHSILFDCGEGTQVAARKAGISLMRTEVIALTHFHGDHIFGLPGLLQTMLSNERDTPLWIVGPEGIERALEPIMQLAGSMPYPVTLLRMPEEGLRLPDWPAEALFTAFPTRHRVPSQGYVFSLSRKGRFLPERARALSIPMPMWSRLQNGEEMALPDGRTICPEEVLTPPRRGIRFLYSGDTNKCNALTDAARECDLAVMEGTYALNEQSEQAFAYGHMTFAHAAEAARDANARELWLTHFSQMQTDPESAIENARAIFPNSVVGRDGMRKTLFYTEE